MTGHATSAAIDKRWNEAEEATEEARAILIEAGYSAAKLQTKTGKQLWAMVHRLDTMEAGATEAGSASTGPQLVCNHDKHGRRGSLSEIIVINDCDEGRTLEYWREITPPGADMVVTFWPNGWGHPGTRANVFRLLGSEKRAPPVAGTMADRVRVQLPHGAARAATRMPSTDGITYLLSLKPGDQQDLESWEAVVPTKPKEPERGSVGQGSLERARQRQAARREAQGG